MLGSEFPRQSRTAKVIWPLLVPGLELTEASCGLFDRIQEVVKQEPRLFIHMEKQLGWVSKLGGVESLWISNIGQTVLARFIESHIWHQLAGSVALQGAQGLRKWTMASCRPDARHLSLS